jgi:hypothetical protein
MKQLTIAVVGGTGKLGTGLAYRWFKAGLDVIIGSRLEEKAAAAAADLGKRVSGTGPRAMTNEAAAAAADVIVLCVPFAQHKAMLEAIKEPVQGKIVVDATVSLNPPKVWQVQLPPEGSAGAIAQRTLGADVRVVSAFQNLAAAHLDGDHEILGDVLVSGNDEAARQTVIDLAQKAGVKAWHAGPIENAAAAEALTSVLISLNRHYKIAGSGIAIVGEPAAP